MSEVKKIFQLTQIHEKQGVRLSPDEGGAVVKFSERASDLLKKLRGRMVFDSEPAGFLRALRDLREEK